MRSTPSSSAPGRRRTASGPPPIRCSARWPRPGAERAIGSCSPVRSTTARPGAAALASAGGRVIVQDPADAARGAACRRAHARGRPPPDHIAACRRHRRSAARRSHGRTAAGAERVEPAPRGRRGPNRPAGPASGFTCPECGGALWELRDGELVRYRCRVGHAYSEDAMVEAQADAVEAALWAALAGARGARRAAAADRRPLARSAAHRATASTRGGERSRGSRRGDPPRLEPRARTPA